MQQERLETYAKLEAAEEAKEKALTTATIMAKPRAMKKDQPIVGAAFGRREHDLDMDPEDSDEPCLEFSDADFDAEAEADERIRLTMKAEKIAREKAANRYNVDNLPPLPAPPAKAPSKARQKGAGRAAIDEAKEQLTRKRALSGDLEPDLEVSKKKTKVLPVGLTKDWRNKISAVGSSKGQVAGEKLTNGVPIGGLGDDDLNDVRLTDIGSKNAIEILSDTEEETPTKPRRRPVPKYSGAPALTEVKSEVKPPVVSGKSGKVEAAMAKDSEIAVLPDFVRDGWTPKFLPTWYHYIGTCDLENWEICELGDEAKAVQHVLNLAFPGNTYRVKKGCPVYTTAMARLGDKRHLIGVMTEKIVDNFFSTAEYIDNRKKIIRYTSWALDDNGPGWYEHPTPRGLVHGASGYTDPTGLFRSQFCLVPLTAFVKSTAKSKGDFSNRFIGAAAMICAGLERAFNQYTSGVKVLNGPFSKSRVGHFVAAFAKLARRLEHSRWTKIMKYCVVYMQSDDGHLLSVSCAMNVDRGTMALGSSPAKADDDDIY
ncbi:hypothetical protein MSAN_01046500 [Mycena sanguinolenta]|uniref:Uncharacterized protein n=1 Tax=Mycena sanguinolenta TaxID=230812 RepID=A0A8H6YMK4_9AGAR|nr:hypothetical protein MSAN_01046500 [Mycena sanguinolenta]